MDLNIKLDGVSGLNLGVDIGSTTIKFALCDEGQLVFSMYKRHLSNIKEALKNGLAEIKDVVGKREMKIAFSGSSGLGVAQSLGLAFVQEVFATSELVKATCKDTSAVIELGGEDAKIIFFANGTDERMNGSCAGGTGAFIDQMATLMNISTSELDTLSLKSEKTYPIASRCGVFAKSDIQPLLNQGARKEDVAYSIYQAIVNQTIVGLAQGREITGKVMFLGGPLTFCKGLRKCFVETLKLDSENAIFPDFAPISVALGSAIYASRQEKTFTFNAIFDLVKDLKQDGLKVASKPLFESVEEYEQFKTRHAKAKVETFDLSAYSGKAYLGIDCGSTTTKLVLISEDNKILYDYYNSNNGNPLELVKEQLLEIYNLIGGKITICGSAVTGYGEELIRSAFGIDEGLVETLAHYMSAKYFNPQVDYILDIGGQDIKCFKIKNNAIDGINLNEACSSGCGSFLETFAKSLNLTKEEFSSLALFAKHPVELGSRCTVFMNSQVKQAQKDGAEVGDISAGLCTSVVKNALYKVIRETDASALGKNVVVQGGTFLNDAVLRAFERELGREVIRPNIAGLMGAFGCALFAKSVAREHSSLIGFEDLKAFTHSSKMVRCKGCTNACNLTINLFSGGKRFISGNQCDKGLRLGEASADKMQMPNLFEFKRQMFKELACENKLALDKINVGLPLALGMYELGAFWKTLFSELGFNVVFSKETTKKTYQKGQYTIPSDTICYPAKVMHGHIMELIEKGVDVIFYPALTYNVDEKKGDNHYNCPVVAYYAEVLRANLSELNKVEFLYPYLNINNDRELAKELAVVLKKYKKSRGEIIKAVEKARVAYKIWRDKIMAEGKRAIDYAREKGLQMLVLASRPYHIDSEISHGIDKFASHIGFVVLSEDSVCDLAEIGKLKVLNQWTFHSRMYASANFASQNSDVELVQLVSFGCGLDAITTDEIRAVLEKNGKLYTQIKIDEITNLGAVKIRLRSLKGVLDERKREQLQSD